MNKVIYNLFLILDDGFSNESPFDDKIMQALLSQYFKISELESYDKTTDFDDYLASF